MRFVTRTQHAPYILFLHHHQPIQVLRQLEFAPVDVGECIFADIGEFFG